MQPHNNPVCIFIGSSVAFGWHASRNHGWAQMLAEQLKASGWESHNFSRPGADTKRALKQLLNAFKAYKPRLVIVGLSLWNEGIKQKGREAVSSFIEGLTQLINMCKENESHVILGGVYPNQNYGELEYQLLLETQEKLKSWKESGFVDDVFDFLTPLDNGKGQWKNGYYSDALHPNDQGHLEMFRCIDLERLEKFKIPSKRAKM